MKKAVYPGSFDPVTYGHLDVIQRGAKLFDELVVLVANNEQKKELLSVEERIKILKKVTSKFKNVKIASHSGLTVDYLKKFGARVILRGIRTISDYEYEFKMALTNRTLAPDIETIFVMTADKYAHISSTLIREIITHRGDITPFVPKECSELLHKKYYV